MFFSVIVPVYNVEKYLNECIDSILNQTFTDFELILVDDGSKDNSGAICDKYAERDSRVKVIHKENGGQSTARNQGVKAASGKFAIFLDSDDFIASNDFFSDLKNIIKAQAQVVIFRYCKYYNEEKKDDLNISFANIAFNNKGELFAELVKRDAFFCSCWSKCVSLELLRKNEIQFDEHLCCEDMDWYYSVVQKAEIFAIIDKVYVNYRQRENSVTSTFNLKSVNDYIYTLKNWWDIFRDMEEGIEKRALLSSLAKLYCNLLISYARNKRALKSFKKEIFSFKPLLKFTMNPRTKKINRCSKFFGLNITCTMLRFLDKVRK